MVTANMYGTPVLNQAGLWLNNSGYGQQKMNRPYNGAVEDISGALNNMQMFANNGIQPFNRMHAPIQASYPGGMMPGAFQAQSVWANNSRFYLPHGLNQPMSHLGSQHSATNNMSHSNNNAVNVNGQVGDVPDLGRRNSLSSNEEFQPRTPYFTAQTLGGPGKIVVPDNSPQTWNSGSPHLLTDGSPQQLWREGNGYVVTDLNALCMVAPAIPRPIPAIFSGDKSRGTVETSLENKNNTTNVYIRGLHPDTTDEMLHAYGSRFGVINSAKSMIDQQTGLCKGFGFIKFVTQLDGENCIRGFYHWGYEAKWARDSHNDKLKKLGDNTNTNLYISNIPMDLDFNEHALMAIFSNYDCLSAKILRDSNGLSRGVGFARFADPDVCRAIINQFNGQPVGPDAQPIAIRFADTPMQKNLKAVTQERRQYKTHEYNLAAFGSPDSPYRHYGPLVAAASSPVLHNRSPLGTQSWLAPQSPYNLGFPHGVMQTNTGISSDNTPSAGRTGPRFTPSSVMLNAAKTGGPVQEIKTEDIKMEPDVGLMKRNPNIPGKSGHEVTTKPQRQLENASAHASAVSSPIKGSPIKVTPLKTSKNTTTNKISGTA